MSYSEGQIAAHSACCEGLSSGRRLVQIAELNAGAGKSGCHRLSFAFSFATFRLPGSCRRDPNSRSAHVLLFPSTASCCPPSWKHIHMGSCPHPKTITCNFPGLYILFPVSATANRLIPYEIRTLLIHVLRSVSSLFRFHPSNVRTVRTSLLTHAFRTPKSVLPGFLPVPEAPGHDPPPTADPLISRAKTDTAENAAWLSWRTESCSSHKDSRRGFESRRSRSPFPSYSSSVRLGMAGCLPS